MALLSWWRIRMCRAVPCKDTPTRSLSVRAARPRCRVHRRLAVPPRLLLPRPRRRHVPYLAEGPPAIEGDRHARALRDARARRGGFLARGKRAVVQVRCAE